MASKIENRDTVKRAILYLRYSSDSQAGGTSLATQEDFCRAYCTQEALEIVEVLKNEAVSASATNEARVNDLLDFVKSNKSRFDVLVVHKLDRFARSQEQHHYLRAKMLTEGILLRSASERIDESPSGKLIEGILASVNEYDNELKRARVKDALQKRIDVGLAPFAPPIGYLKDKNRPEGVKLTPHLVDPTRSKIVKHMFLDYSLGAHSQVMLAKKYGFLKQTVFKILNRPFYMGMLQSRDGTLIKGLHKPLVTADLWYKCQDVMHGKSNNTRKPRLVLNADFPLRGFLLCDYCDRTLTGCHPKSKKFSKMYCFNRDCEVYSKSIDTVLVNQDFWELLKRVKASEKTKELVKTRLIPKYNARRDELNARWRQGSEWIQRLEQQQDWVSKQASTGKIPSEVASRQIRAYQDEILKAKKPMVRQYPKEVTIYVLLEYAYRFLEQVADIWADGDFEARIQLQRLIFKDKVHYNVKTRSFRPLRTHKTPLFSLNDVIMGGEGDFVRTLPQVVLGLHELYSYNFAFAVK